MRLGIDASNIRDGGGITHLTQILAAADAPAYGFEKVVVWASGPTLSKLRDRRWLIKRHDPVLDGHYARRALWQRTRLGRLAHAEGCDLLFMPGGTFATTFRPVVTMSRNMLPFEGRELLRYGFSQTTLRLLLLRWSQSRSFRKADGTIFLTRHAQRVVSRSVWPLRGETAIIPHGLDTRFFLGERTHRSIEECTETAPLRIIYISIIDLYKHQWHVAEAVARLRSEGLPISLTMIGPAYPPALARLERVMRRFDGQGRFLQYLGPVPHEQLPACYERADLCLFASSCENMPNILLEGMASGLPIACSNRGPMPEVLGSAGVYFDPEKSMSIAAALRELVESVQVRREKAHASLERARQYCWQKCAAETFEFIAKVARMRAKQDVGAN